MVKAINVTMPDGSVWQVPAQPIAEARARYYAELDSSRGEGEYEAIYRRELAFTLRDDDELLDWASGNNNWSDVADTARRLPTNPPPVDYQDGWVNGEKEVVEAPDAD